MAFSYFFLEDSENLLYPIYSIDGLRYGTISEAKFERRFLSAHVTTALDAATTSPETGSLHEVEIVVPFEKNSDPVSLGGWVWLDEEGIEELGDDKWQQRLGELQVGGERRYGFGRMRIKGDFTETQNIPDGYHIISGHPRPQIRVAAGRPLLAHTLVEDNVKISGMIEPVVGRETQDGSNRFGSNLTKANVCWTPGSVADESYTFQIRPDGLWEIIV
ncbi:MAG: hypothetical protein K6U80_08625 [Firmicutes bacterium]|nr:hypothetical protein [Bacillota bacterium]